MSTSKDKSNKRLTTGIVVIGGLFLVAGLSPYLSKYLTSNPDQPQVVEVSQPTPEPQTFTEVEPTAKEKTVISEVTAEPEVATDKEVVAKETQPQLPSLHESDDFFLNEIDDDKSHSLFVHVDIIRNMVVFIDNFSRGQLVANFSPLQRPKEAFSVSTQKGTLIINSDSYLRYDSYAQLIDSLDTEKFIQIYTLISPLINEAYQEIGYPAGSFNQTFDKAIDHLLDTPIIHYKLELTSSSVMYQYADENIESLPDTQKLMLRMGPDNLQIVQEKLREIQSELQRL